MLVQNVLAGVLLVQAEAEPGAAGRAAGLPDVAGGMVTTTATATALQGHHAGLKTEVIAAVTLANFAGLVGCGEARQAVHQGAA